ncbi:barstar family protein [Candidatus Symbiobacter mobilis]|uniref:Barstar (barnase inhibitor) domain-containing protein n=1 Tax=Candidatus Symbiobacter mobilis CR TaxID=946483 RepID=U5N5V0_9BURK|nr:barstar family protein [Candidatus Symbiobacter mobilis]AGX86742.1 hypothetical protein Cenrod_0634 [Candidatus Symbiobacter mobilis CR]
MPLDSSPICVPSSLRIEALLASLRPNVVQSIQAYRVHELEEVARTAGHRFLRANLATAQSKQEVFDVLCQQFGLGATACKNFDALHDSLSDGTLKTAGYLGFIIVLEHLPCHAKFDKEAREQLLDTFRDAAEHWGEKKVPFRCFYSFSVALPAAGARGADADADAPAAARLLDVSLHALRMSSPFNPNLWS